MSSTFKWTNFVRSSELETVAQKSGKLQKQHKNQLVGSEIKTFYDDLIAETKVESLAPSAETSKQKNEELVTTSFTNSKDLSKKLEKVSKKELLNKSSLTNHSANAFLKAAQDNNVQQLQQQLENGCDINVKDIYGWTALMCAVCNNAVESVKYLLKSGSDINICNNQQLTALDIAKKEKKECIIKLLAPPLNSIPSKTVVKKPDDIKFYCDSCKLHFEHTTKIAHQSSTIHLFNTTKKKTPVFYHIPEHNIGFQMLLKDGWDQEQGLGPDGSGQKFPVKTVLKRDRKGLGNSSDDDDKKAKARITHFGPYDISAVKPKEVEKRQPRAKTLSKKKKEIQHNQQIQKEIKFRRLFHEPD